MIALITPTGSRPIQFELCMHWMFRQTYPSKVVWVIVDDAIPRTTDNVLPDFRDNWDIIKVYPTPIWHGQNTQARNIVAGVQTLINKYSKEEIEAIFIIEDDDYYRPIYLERMMAHFNGYHLLGEINTIYYNVCHGRYVVNSNNIHASLFQTAFKYEVIPQLNESLSNKFIDYVFWSKVANKHLFYEHDLAVGIKGLPGRGGIGAGHSNAMAMRADPNLNYLRALIGNEDTQIYEKYYRDNSKLQRGLFTKKSL